MRQNACVCVHERTKRHAVSKQLGSNLLSPIQHPTIVLRTTATFTLEFSKYLCEKVRVCVDAQHLGAGGVDDGEATVPEGLFTCLN